MPLQLYKIASVELTSNSSPITFSNIPQGYKDLKLVMSLRGANNNTFNYVSIAFNGVTTNQAMISVFGGDVSNAQSGTQTNFQFISMGSNTTANTFGSHELYIPNYTSSSNKSASLEIVNENNSTASGAVYLVFSGLLWSNTAAITSVSLTGITGILTQGSTATLYGIL